MTMYSIAIHLVDRAYGGPEEGGWWYTYGEPVIDDPDFPCPVCTHIEADAIAIQERMEKFIETLEPRRSINSVLSEGEYWAVIQEGLPQAWPVERPHYE